MTPEKVLRCADTALVRLGVSVLNTSEDTEKNVCPQVTEHGGRINDLTSGEQTRDSSVMEPMRQAQKETCKWCSKSFVHVKKHVWRCKMRPQDSVRKDSVHKDSVHKSEPKPSQEPNHSADEVEASSLHFLQKSTPAPDIELRPLKKLSLPPANDKGKWSSIDEDLYMICSGIIEKDPVKKLSKLEGLVYAYLEAGFEEEKKSLKITEKKTESSETKCMRAAKKSVSKQTREAKSAGDSERQKSLKLEYLKLVRLHNKSRRNDLRKKRKKDAAKEQRNFKSNPYEYGKKLLSDTKQAGEPTFSREDAGTFFKKEYSDRNRGKTFEPLSGLPTAQRPKVEFNLDAPTKEEFDQKLKTRRNKSSPGPNGVPYMVYKRCCRLSNTLFEIMVELWEKKMIPQDWTIGESILIAKSQDYSDPTKFRNITMTNTSGKINMGILADKMMDYMVDNGYINRSVQKGFLKKTPGCIEHTQALMEELQDAKRSRRQIYVVWVDLMNAYGRVPHNLILFALRHYHFPEQLVEYLHKYYDELLVRVKTKKWKTDWFYYLIGLFQGDPLSVILFLIVFNLLLDYLSSHKNLGYMPSFASEETSNRAFADDLTLMSKSMDKIKEQIRIMEEFLNWTRNMKAKPSKCVAVGMKIKDGRYVSFDPCLKIGGENISYLGGTPIKFLGHWIYVNLSDSETRKMIVDKLTGMLVKVDESVINGIMKCWVYNHLITSKVTWELMVYNLPITFVRELEALCTKYLKSWLGVTRSITNSVLYRSKDHFGLALKKLSDLFKTVQVGKGHMMKTSEDPKVREAFKHRQQRYKDSKQWNYVTELAERERDLYFQELVGYVQSDRKGLGFNKERKLCERDRLKQLVASISESEMLQALYSKRVQGKFLTWENTMQLDVSWNNLIYNYSMSPELLKFHFNSIHETAHTPANMKLWNYASSSRCLLCGWSYCNLKHILTCCKVALDGKRYNWRHDQVLRAIGTTLQKRLETPVKKKRKKKWVVFKSNSGKYNIPDTQRTALEEEDVLNRAKDWVLVQDEDNAQRQFPQHIVNTPLRPDIVVYSDELKTVFLVELTCGDESNFEDQRARKESRYQQLLVEIESAGWSTKLFTVEVGCRGLYHHTLPRLFNFFGIPRQLKKKALSEIAMIALRCSYTIWLARDNKIWTDYNFVTS